MQSAALRRGLIALFLWTIGLTAAAENLSYDNHRKEVSHASGEQHQKAEQPPPIEWELPAEISEKPAAKNQQGANANREQSDNADLYAKRNTIAAEKQADFAERQYYVGIFGAFVGILAALFTWQAAVAARDAAQASKVSADEAKSSNEQTQNLFALEQRALIMIEFTGNSALIWEEKGARFNVGIRLKNVGKLLATNVWYEAVAFAAGEGEGQRASVDTLKRYCNSRAESRESIVDNGVIIPPNGGFYDINFGVLLFREDIEKNIFLPPDFFLGIVKICATYRCATHKTTLYTGRMYSTVLPMADGLPRMLRLSDGNLPAEKYGLAHLPNCDIAT